MRRLAPLLLLLASCGYTVGDLYEHRDVKVQIFDNVSERRTHEFDLTNAILHEMANRGIRVNNKGASHTLEGRILDIRNPSVVEGKSDVVLVGSLVYTIEARLVGPGPKHEEVWKEQMSSSVSFAAQRGETLESARQEVIDRVARWIVARLEKKW